MKICSNYKKAIEDDANFCQYCGSSSFEQIDPRQNFSQPQNFDYQQNANPAPIPAVTAVKSLVSSALFTAAVILFTVYAVFQLIPSLVDSSTVFSMEVLTERYPNIKINESFLPTISTYSIAVTLLTGIPNFLICAGLWMFWKNCKDTKNLGIQTGGLRFLRTSVIVVFVTQIIALVIAMIFIDALLHNIDYPKAAVIGPGNLTSAVTGTVLAIVTIVIGGAITLYSFYYTKALKTLKSVTNVVTTGVPSDYVSMFVVVMNYIFAFFAFLEMFGNFLAFVAQGTFAAFLIIMTVLIIKYRDQMRVIIYQNNYSSFNAADNSGFNA